MSACLRSVSACLRSVSACLVSEFARLMSVSACLVSVCPCLRTVCMFLYFRETEREVGGGSNVFVMAHQLLYSVSACICI